VSGENEQLTQEEVDALFQQATGKSVARNQAPPGPTPPERREQPEQASASPAKEPERPEPAIHAAAVTTTATLNPRPPGSNGGNGAGLEEMRRLVSEINRSIAGLEKRISGLEAEVNQLKQPGPGGREASARVSRLSHEVQSIKVEMHHMKSGLQSTPGYRLQKDFKCESCGAQGAVATLHRCTSCGQQGWFGWWPAKNE